MWAYVKDGSIVQTNNFQTNLIINNTNFPTKYANEWTPDQKKAYGVYEVEEVNRSNLKDGNYYINDDVGYYEQVKVKPTHQCEFGCGFKGTYEDVSEHEARYHK